MPDIALDHRAHGTGQQGFVLVAVLAALALLAVVAITLTRTVSLDTKVVAYIARQARAESLADGVARLTFRHLVVNPPAGGKSGLLRIDGIPINCQINGSLVRLTVIDTLGQVNLNLASPEMLERLFAGVGAPADERVRLAQAVIDFRSLGDTATDGGSKLAAYQLAGLPHGPKYNAFESVGELDQVLGMTPALLKRLRPLVTVQSRFAIVNPAVASLPVLMALSEDPRPPPIDPTPQALDALRAALQLPPSFTYVAKTRSTPPVASTAYLVRAAVRHAAHGQFVRQAVVDVSARGPAGFTIREWSEGDPDEGFAAGDPADAPACIGGVLWTSP